MLATIDLGPARVAYALGISAVTVPGGGKPAAYLPLVDGPYRMLAHEVPCRPCDYADCPVGYRCLEGVAAQQAAGAAEVLIRQPGEFATETRRGKE